MGDFHHCRKIKKYRPPGYASQTLWGPFKGYKVVHGLNDNKKIARFDFPERGNPLSSDFTLVMSNPTSHFINFKSQGLSRKKQEVVIRVTHECTYFHHVCRCKLTAVETKIKFDLWRSFCSVSWNKCQHWNSSNLTLNNWEWLNKDLKLTEYIILLRGQRQKQKHNMVAKHSMVDVQVVKVMITLWLQCILVNTVSEEKTLCVVLL